MRGINILWIFLIFSFFGWLFSCLYYWIKEKKFYNKGFLTLPFSPTYGASAVICYAAFDKITDNIFIIFIGTGLLLSAFSVVLGIIGENILGCKPWDFSDMKLSLGNYTTIPIALLLGAGGAFSVKLLIPMVYTIIGYIPPLVSMIIALSLTALILIDYILSFITIILLKKKIRKLDSHAQLLGAEITEEQLKELEQNYNRLFTDNILRKRMTSAFPELRREEYVKQITQKLDDIKQDNMKQYSTVYDREEDKPFASGLCFEKLFALFVIGSFIGTCIETVYALIVEGHFECRVGLVYGPFIPVYGDAGVYHRRGDRRVF